MKTIKKILGWTGGGVHKRIDENRELLELLRREAPDFLEKHREVVGWLQAHDEFFVDLASAVKLEEGRFLAQAQTQPERFPRPWPTSSSAPK